MKKITLQKKISKDWDEALDFWNNPNLNDPDVHWTKEKLEKELRNVMAWIKMGDRQVNFNIQDIIEKMGKDAFMTYAVKILGIHEIGHDAYCPFDLPMCLLFDYEANRVLRNSEKAQYVENLFADIMDNTRSFQKGSKNLVDVYKKLGKDAQSKSYKLYLRASEMLWNQPEGTLVTGITEEMKGDAEKIEDIIKKAMDSDDPHKDWPNAMNSFAKVMKDYVKDETIIPSKKGNSDSNGSGDPTGSGNSSSSSGNANNNSNNNPNNSSNSNQNNTSQGNSGSKTDKGEDKQEVPPGFIDYHSPKDFAPVNPKNGDDKAVDQVLEKALRGIARRMSPQQYSGLMSRNGLAKPKKATIWFYRDMAHQFDVRLPYANSRSGGGSPSSVRTWDINDPISELDILLSLEYGVMIPGETTRKRLTDGLKNCGGEGGHPDMLICLDCSGSMPDPQKYRSIPVLSSMVVAHAALRCERKVAVVLFSHVSDHLDYTRDKELIDNKLTDFLQGGTMIPAKLMADIVRSNPNPQHIIVVSDTDIYNMNKTTMNYLKDALDSARAGGTVFLTYSHPGCSEQFKKIGYNVIQMQDQKELLKLSLDVRDTLYGG